MSDQSYGRDQPDYRYAGEQAAGYPGEGDVYPDIGEPGYGPPSSEAPVHRGFLRSLFDFGFNSFVTPRVVKVVYAIVMLGIGLSALAFLIFAFRTSAVFGVISLCILCPLYFVLNLALWRILLELIIVIFRIADDLRSIRLRGD